MVKILAIVIAILLRSYVVDTKNPEKKTEIRNIPVTIKNEEEITKQGLTIISPDAVTVNVEVSGRLKDMREFDRGSIDAYLDLEGYQEGKVNVPINVRLLDNYDRIRIVSFEPRHALFTIERTVSRSKPIHIVARGEAADGYVLGTPTSETTMVTVKGPLSIVNQIDQVVANIDVDQWSSTNFINAELTPINENGQEVTDITLDTDSTLIKVPVYKIKEVPIEPVTVNEVGEGLILESISISPETIMIRGEVGVDDIESIRTAPLDLSTIVESGEKQVSLMVPEGFGLVNPSENLVTFEFVITEEETKNLIYPISSLNIQGVADRTVNILDEIDEVQVSITGERNLIQTLDLDAVGLESTLNPEEERQVVEIQVTGVPDEFKVAVTPPSIEVELISEIEETSE